MTADPDRPGLRHLSGELFRFVNVGAVAALTDLIAYLLYQLVMPTDMAKALSFLTGAGISFYGHKHVTFRRDASGRRAIALFWALYAATLVLNVVVNRAMLLVLGHGFIALGLAWFVATAISSGVNFIGTKLMVFSGRSLGRTAAPPTVRHVTARNGQ